MRTALLIAGLIALFASYHSSALSEATAEGYQRGYERGYQQGHANGHALGGKEALATNPASDRLELVCASLWMEVVDQTWEKNGLP